MAASLIVTPGVDERKQEALTRIESADSRDPFTAIPGTVQAPNLPPPTPPAPRVNPAARRAVAPTGVRVALPCAATAPPTHRRSR
ncbi:MAG: hypothetical protein HC918_09190 [Oscillatoriales cyanobacterium SM2_1_8]|nr:hypothetical protein [Oscillatoriales cyanobacterium SM2_1_8]